MSGSPPNGYFFGFHSRVSHCALAILAPLISSARASPASAAILARALIPGYGSVCSAELADEIGTIARFRSEISLALYLGMATLDHSSGKFRGSKAPKHVNTRAKAGSRGKRRSLRGAA